MDMYNFEKDESRINIIKVPCVTKKSVTPLGYVVNPYQKPIGLGSWFVTHFSRVGDWVLDLCCGTGATLVAALLHGRNASGVDKSLVQVGFVKSRVMTLDSVWNLYEEAREGGQGVEGLEIQPPVNGQLALLGTTTFDVETIVETEETEKDEPPRTPEDNDFNDLLLD